MRLDHINSSSIHSTTILCVRGKDTLVLAGDGQVTFGNMIVMKSNAKKLRRLAHGSVVAGFAGSTSDAMALFERLEEKLEKHQKQLMKACVALGKEWRMDKYLRRLEATMIVADKKDTLIIDGDGNVIEPEDNIIAIGSGAQYAMAACYGMMEVDPKHEPEKLAITSLKIAAKMCIYTNDVITMEKISLK